MSSVAQRVVVASRSTEYAELIRRHGTRAQAAFFLERRGQSLADIDARHAAQEEAVKRVLNGVPVTWRRSRVDRRDLSRFVFEPEDMVVAVGQDGLVANVAKYLTGQRVIGVNPDPKSYDGVLVRHASSHVAELLVETHAARTKLEQRAMVQVELDDGQRLFALNEVFLGHGSHQSARYRIRIDGVEERHSSSGAIVATGTGATGWARSIQRERKDPPALPKPDEARLVYFVREAFPSVRTQTTLTQGSIAPDRALEITSEMNERGVVFGDGIEDDRLEFGYGVCARVALAKQRLALVI